MWALYICCTIELSICPASSTWPPHPHSSFTTLYIHRVQRQWMDGARNQLATFPDNSLPTYYICRAAVYCNIFRWQNNTLMYIQSLHRYNKTVSKLAFRTLANVSSPSTTTIFLGSKNSYIKPPTVTSLVLTMHYIRSYITIINGKISSWQQVCFQCTPQYLVRVRVHVCRYECLYN
jgi:hypothetical protein